MKNNVLVTGLGVGYELQICPACNSDFSWLINNPSILIWSDKIYITQKIWETINDSLYIRKDKSLKAVNIIMNKAYDDNIIEIINPAEIYSISYAELLEKQVEYDIETLRKRFSNIKKGNEGVPGEIIIDGEGYCQPYIGTIYLSLSLAEHLNATCLFNKRELNFLNYKFGLDLPDRYGENNLPAFEEIFKVTLPDELVLHNYAFIKEEICNKCINLTHCQDSYLLDIENNVSKLLKWRDYDEIYQLKDVINEIKKTKNSISNTCELEDIKDEFMLKAKKINKNINRVFPKVKRWTNLETMVSVPVAIGSAMLGNYELSVASAGITGISKITDEYMEYYKNKHNWIGFINKK